MEGLGRWRLVCGLTLGPALAGRLDVLSVASSVLVAEQPTVEGAWKEEEEE